VIIDKDNRPCWDPATIEDIDPADVEAYFAPLSDGELEFGPYHC
jgi:enoyl-CoA hydratase